MGIMAFNRTDIFWFH